MVVHRIRGMGRRRIRLGRRRKGGNRSGEEGQRMEGGMEGKEKRVCSLHCSEFGCLIHTIASTTVIGVK